MSEPIVFSDASSPHLSLTRRTLPCGLDVTCPHVDAVGLGSTPNASSAIDTVTVLVVDAPAAPADGAPSIRRDGIRLRGRQETSSRRRPEEGTGVRGRIV